MVSKRRGALQAREEDLDELREAYKQAGIAAHFRTLAEASDLPILVYNVPARTASDIAAASVTPEWQGTRNAPGAASPNRCSAVAF